MVFCGAVLVLCIGCAKGGGATKRTRCGTTRISTKSTYFTHHTQQQIAKAAVMYDALAIVSSGSPCSSILKQTCLRAGVAAHTAALINEA